jgi:predicted phage tail protein
MADQMSLHADAQPLTEEEYANRVLPDRESPYEVGATLLAALAIVLGITALLFTPFKPGFLGILLATLSNAVAGQNSRLPRIAMVVAGVGWLLGGVLSVLADEAVW